MTGNKVVKLAQRTFDNQWDHSPAHARGVKPWLTALMGFAFFLLSVTIANRLQSQEVKIWEFSPYSIEVWYVFDSDVSLSATARDHYLRELEFELQRNYRAAWDMHFSPVPTHLQRDVLNDMDRLDLQRMTRNELVLVVSTTHEEAKTVRTYDAAAESLTAIYVSQEIADQLNRSAEKAEVDAESATAKLLQKLQVDDAGQVSVGERLASGSIAAAFLPRSFVSDLESVRPLITMLPWQAESVVRARDKLLFLTISMEGDDFRIRTREMDCTMQFMGPVYSGYVDNWARGARLTAKLMNLAFAPVARVEEAETATAELRHRAGGLIVDGQNPARLQVGDVLQPIIRRDDKNGVPTLLQALSFTYAAITESDGIKMNANVYTYSGGPGLQGRKNRRTQRVLLRVRPITEQSDIQIVVRGDAGRAQAGCFVYQRDMLTEEFELMGRTDWRGRLTVDVPQQNTRVLPEAIRVARVAAKREAEAKARADAEAAAQAENANSEESGAAPAPVSVEPLPVADVPIDEATLVQLNAPLLQIYVKSGDNVLAKLPFVPGLQQLETAELPDDSLRLQSEALVRGFQGEILDLIGLRNLLAAKVKLYVKDDKNTEAQRAMEQLRGLKNFNEMNDELSQIERNILESAGGEVPRSAQSRIDRMFKTTRDMLQKYLQDELVAETARLIRSDIGEAGETAGS